MMTAKLARVRQEAVVAEVARRALVAESLPAFFTEAVALVASTLAVPFSSVLERRSDGASFVLRAGIGWTNVQVGVTQVPIRSDTQAGYAILHNESVLVQDLDSDRRFASAPLLRDDYIGSGITVVIPGTMHPYGVLEAHDHKSRDFSQDDANFLQAIADVIGTAVERTRTQAAVAQAQRLEAVGRLASGISHDFNNVLTAITGYAELVRAGLDTTHPLQEDVSEILNAAGRATALTKQLLAFSRQQVLEPRVVMLNDIVAGVEKMLRRIVEGEAGGPGIEFVISLHAGLGLVRADPGQLEQVIVNLVVNARDAMPHGGTLTIETSNTALGATHTPEYSVERPGNYVMLAVTDTGTGMDGETKARIFEPFFTTKPQEQGTGLGLATVYGIVKQSGGEVWVYSEVRRGSTFKVFLPRLHSGVAAHPAEPARPATVGGTETILLAEDEEPIRRLTARILERAGYRVLAANNGEDALLMAQRYSGPIALLVTDMMMPKMNGRVLAERLRMQRPQVRVLLLSGYTDATVGGGGAPALDAQFLQKPFASDALTRKVREALDSLIVSTR